MPHVRVTSDVRTRSVGGNFVASNSTPIVPLLAAPQETRAYRMLGVSFTGWDAQNNNDRCILALNHGTLDTAETVETGGVRTVNIADPFNASRFLKVFALAAVTGGSTGGAVTGNHYIDLHGLLIVERVDVLVNLPDNTTDLTWFVTVYYEEVAIAKSEWARLRHRTNVEMAVVGFVTV